MQIIKTYNVAGHCFRVTGDRLCKATEGIAGFRPFEVVDDEPGFTITEDSWVPAMNSLQYSFGYEDVEGAFGRFADGTMLILRPADGAPLHLWHYDGSGKVLSHGNYSLYLLRFALWVGFGIMALPKQTVAVHSSCIVCKDKAVLILGESGTGKSTHTRLWRENIEGAFLLNDDSPMIRVHDGGIWVCGSPWSGKTPCYRPEKYRLKACVRLSQAKENHMRRLSTLQAYAALHPSCPPQFAYDRSMYGHVGDVIGTLVQSVPVYHLECLPDPEAAKLACSTIFNDI